MDREQKKLLADIKLAIEKIDIHLQGKRDWDLFSQNITIQSAVKYEFSIIGEAMYELMKMKPDFAVTDAKKIVAFRNRMVHEYDAIDNVQVWSVVVNYLPKLKSEVEALLGEG